MIGTQNIANYYDLHSLEEDLRLSSLSMEYLMTMRIIELNAPNAKTVCDLGGGTGVYAIPMAESGKNVLLLDISKKEIEIAKQKAIQAKVQLKTEQCDLFDDTLNIVQKFDLVLCLGPLYHCRDIKDVEIVLDKISFIMHYDSIAIIAFISKYSKYNNASRSTILHEDEIKSVCDYYTNFKQEHSVFSFQDKLGLPVSFIEPKLIKDFLMEKGFAVLDLVVCDIFGHIGSEVSLADKNNFLEVAHEIGRLDKLNDGNHVLMVIKKHIN